MWISTLDLFIGISFGINSCFPLLFSCIWYCSLNLVLIFRAMGFPTEFFPVLFAIPRMAGWLAHWKESLDDPDTKIMRPQQVSVIKKILSSIVTMSMNLM